MTSSDNAQPLNNELQSMRDRYLKLVDLHGQLQVQNSVLEDRLLSLIESSTEEKDRLESALVNAEEQIRSLQETVKELQMEKQRYKDDCNLAVRLLHRNPQEFLPMSSDDVELQLKNRYESNASNVAAQRPMLLPTFPPTFFAPPVLLSTSSSTRSPVENVRLTAETLFKSNSVHRFPSNTFLCSDCQRTVKRCDVSVQTSLTTSQNHNQTEPSRLRLVSLSSSDDGTWLALDSPPSYRLENECPRTKLYPTHSHTDPSYNISNMFHV